MQNVLMMAVKADHGKIEPELLTVEQVSQFVGLGVRTVWSKVSAGEFPRPVRIGRATRWRRSEILRWIDALAE